MSLFKGEIWTARHAQREDNVRRDREKMAVYKGKRPGTNTFLVALGRTDPAVTLILKFWPLEPWDNKFLLLKPPSMWHSLYNPRKLIHSLMDFYFNVSPFLYIAYGHPGGFTLYPQRDVKWPHPTR